MSYRVLVDANFHYLDRSQRHALGEYPTYAEAFAACTEVVDRFLRHEYVSGMTASALYFRFMMFGHDPFLVNGADGTEALPGFSAWDYARQRCSELCEAPPPVPALDVRLNAWGVPRPDATPVVGTVPD